MSGELLIGWRNLRELGLGFRDGRDGKPISVLLRRIGAECHIVEGGDEEEELMAREIGNQIDRKLWEREGPPLSGKSKGGG